MEEEEAMAIATAARETVPQMFWRGVRERGPRTIFRQKHFGIWQPVTWSELGAIAREVGMGLASLGFAPGEVASDRKSTRLNSSYT